MTLLNAEIELYLLREKHVVDMLSQLFSGNRLFRRKSVSDSSNFTWRMCRFVPFSWQDYDGELAAFHYIQSPLYFFLSHFLHLLPPKCNVIALFFSISDC